MSELRCLIVKLHCYTSQLKYVFWLEENVSRVIGKSFMTPEGEQSLRTVPTNSKILLPRFMIMQEM